MNWKVFLLPIYTNFLNNNVKKKNINTQIKDEKNIKYVFISAFEGKDLAILKSPIFYYLLKIKCQ